MTSATFGFLIDNQAGAEAICRAPEGCGEVMSIDVSSLASRYGRAVTLDQLQPRLRCRNCRRKGRLIIECWAGRHGPIKV